RPTFRRTASPLPVVLSRCAPGHLATILAVANRPFVRHSRPRMGKRFYITTAIDYLNGEPHLGHAYEKVVADVIARAHRSLGDDVFFLTGVDEHGQKVQQAALSASKRPQSYCDEMAATWKVFARKVNLNKDAFIVMAQT